MVVEALRLSGQRGILASGWGGLGKGVTLTDSIFLLDNAPHDWLFPKMSAIVHHGGVGTTGAGLRAGVPNVVIPHFADQQFWGSRVAKLGAGPEPISRKHLSAQRLASAIHATIQDEGIRSRAAIIGERIKNENGVDRAIDVIHQYLPNHEKS